jgi:hypothetical protein
MKLPKPIVRRLAPTPKYYVTPKELLRAFPNGMRGQSEDSPSYEILLNGIHAEDYFTTLTTNRFVRQQLGTFSVSLDDWQFEKWGKNLARWQPVIISIDGTRIFKGRIDKILQHYDKGQDGYLTTVTGRDDAGPLQDITFSKNYDSLGPIHTSKDILTDLITNVYPSLKGTLDPALTVDMSAAFEAKSLSPYGKNWDRVSFWQALEEICEDIEGTYAAAGSTFFLDFWVDENDVLHITQTGELALTLDPPIGGYGGDWIKTSDWTLDGLPIKNSVWFWGGGQDGVLPLQWDTFWSTVHNQLPAHDPWLDDLSNPYPYFQPTLSPGLFQSLSLTTKTNTSNSPAGRMLHLHATSFIQTFQLQMFIRTPGDDEAFPPIGSLSWTGAPYASFGYIYVPPYVALDIPMPFKPSGLPTGDAHAFDIFGRGPGGHLNWYNNDVMDESMGEISAVNISVNPNSIPVIQAMNVAVALVDGQDPDPMAMVVTVPCAGKIVLMNSSLGLVYPSLIPWANLTFPIGPNAGGSLCPTTINGWGKKFFDWANITHMTFYFMPGYNITQNALGLASLIGIQTNEDLEIDIGNLCFTKPLVAQSIPAPTDSVHSAIVTDTTVTNYQFAQLRACYYAAQQAEPQSYVTYQIFGRPDLQVAHTFEVEGETLLIRQSTTTATKQGGYYNTVQAWKPLP